MQLQGISACVTGAGSGLGLATSKMLSARGANVVLIDLPSSAGEAEAAAIGSTATFVAADVRDEVKRLIQTLASDGTGFILGPCHNLQAITPLENITALYAAAHVHGSF